MAIHQEIAGRVLVVTIDNPEVKNAFDQPTIAALSDLFEVEHVEVGAMGREPQDGVLPVQLMKPP